MKKNIGVTDELFRTVLAIVIFAVGAYYASWWGFLGLIPLLTAAFGCCPLYLLLGFTTR